MKSHLKNGLSYALLVVVFFGAVKHLSPHFGQWQSVIGILILAFELYVPLMAIEREKSSLRAYALCFPAHWKQELRSVVWFSFLTLCPYALIIFTIDLWVAGSQGLSLAWNFPWEAFAPQKLISQVFVIALPEEIYFRGFLQTHFVRAWPKQYYVLRLPIGKATIVVNAIFALAHLVGEYQPARLLPFFPGLLFSALTLRSGSIFGAVIYHALCNILSETLGTGFSIARTN